ncbi:Bud site selection protein, Revert to axial protein 1 [Podila epicladia]|nr:Bud site selection protein, Revert to axial protein 1 [Podila epicladia]KAG0097174.1 Bud site selection protein, Revert to axial protein 1 [Podila epicladia]
MSTGQNHTRSVSNSTGSSQSRKPQLEAIQTQKAQASVTFRPISSTSSVSYYDGSSHLRPTSGINDGLVFPRPISTASGMSGVSGVSGVGDKEGIVEEDATQHQPPYQPDPEKTIHSLSVQYAQDLDPLPPSSTLSSFPFTPSTLVDSVPSPVESEQQYPHSQQPPQQTQHAQQDQQRHDRVSQPAHEDVDGSFQTIPLSPSREIPHLNQQKEHAQGKTPLRHHHVQYQPTSSHQLQRSSSSHHQPHPQHPQQRRTSTNFSSSPKQLQQQHQGSQGMDITYSTSSDDSRTHHLPNLWQVLNRKTLPPVCLFNFYLYMRDFEKSSEEVDFWLDVTAHEVLWRLYVRATKRRAALAAAERAAEREEMEALKAAQAEAEKWKSQIDEDQEQGKNERQKISTILDTIELAKKGHEQKSSVTLDMYEPHWSAANRYLELSGETRPPPIPEDKNQDVTHSSHHLKDKSSDPLMLQAGSPKSPLSPSSTLGRPHQHLVGAIPSNWEAPLESPSSGLSRSQSSGGPSAHIGAEMMTSTSANTIARARSNAEGKSAAALKRMSMAGVSKEDLFRSAERIYYKYLIPQAEKCVRIPGSVRHRVAVYMDGKIKEHMSHKDGVPTAASSTGTSRQKEKFVSLETYGSASSLSQLSESAAGGTGGTATTLSTPANNKIRRKNSNNKSMSSQHSFSEKGKDPMTNSSSTLFPQPDQDLGLVFAEAREIVFEGMESYYFPRFIRARAYGNMVYSQRLFRLVLGLFLMFVGFTIVLCLIFLNVQPRSMRAWAMIPMFIGILLCTTFQFNICPLLVLMQVSETKWMQFAKIREPYIMMLHRRRALKVVAVAVLYTLCIGILFGLLPGHRL